jgi:DNA polymerase-3 subunit epsilon
MRQVMLDTETTGLSPQNGDRIVELGCVELLNRKLTGNNKHYYLNPERESDEGALRVHGLTTEFLSDKPKFAEIADDFLSYIAGAEVIIHNAPFDVGFLESELARANKNRFTSVVTKVVDSLAMAKHQYPGKRNR